MGLKFTKGDIAFYIPFNNVITSNNYLIFESGGGSQYINLTENINETSFSNIRFTKDNITRYVKTKYSFGTIFDKNFDALGWGGSRGFNELALDSQNYGKFRKVSGISKVQVGHVQHRPGDFYTTVLGYDDKGAVVFNKQVVHLNSYSASPNQWASISWSVDLPQPLRVVIRGHGQVGDPKGSNSGGDNTLNAAQITNVILEL